MRRDCGHKQAVSNRDVLIAFICELELHVDTWTLIAFVSRSHPFWYSKPQWEENRAKSSDATPSRPGHNSVV